MKRKREKEFVKRCLKKQEEFGKQRLAEKEEENKILEKIKLDSRKTEEDFRRAGKTAFGRNRRNWETIISNKKKEYIFLEKDQIQRLKINAQ